MGYPVVHFEVLGKDPDKLRGYYGELFGWEFQHLGGPSNYSVVQREGNTAPDGSGIGGGIGGGMEGYDHVTFYVAVPDVGEALDKAEALGGERTMGPDKMDEPPMVLGQFKDPEGHVIGLVTPLDMPGS
jgi:predicted enzyme related to lactoylglutathione lyase